MTRSQLALSPIALYLAWSCIGCSGSSEAPPAADLTGGTTTAVEQLTSCDTIALAAGDTVQGTNLTVTLVDLTPSPPVKFDANRWVVELRTNDGNPLTDLSAWHFEAVMVAHNHDTIQRPTITALSTAGQYEIDAINLWMDGLWDVRFRLTEDAVDDSALFYACISQP